MMIWFSASCSLIILPNSLGLPALPLRMTCLTHHPPHQRYHRVEFPAQARQRELFPSALGPLDALGYFLCEPVRETIVGMIETTHHRKWLISVQSLGPAARPSPLLVTGKARSVAGGCEHH